MDAVGTCSGGGRGSRSALLHASPHLLHDFELEDTVVMGNTDLLGVLECITLNKTV